MKILNTVISNSFPSILLNIAYCIGLLHKGAILFFSWIFHVQKRKNDIKTKSLCSLRAVISCVDIFCSYSGPSGMIGF